MKYSLDVFIDPSITGIEHAALRQVVFEQLAAHLQTREGLTNDLRLSVFVNEFIIGETKCQVELSLVGVANQLPFNGHSRAVRMTTNLHIHAGPAGIVGAIAGAAISIGLHGALNSGKESYLMQCISECIAELATVIDTAIGKEESSTTKTWRWVSGLRWKVALAAPVLLMVPAVWFMGPIGIAAGFIAIPLLGVSSFLLVHLVGLGLMPSRFFMEDPLGQRQMARSGVKNVLLVRLICFVLLFPAVIFIIMSVAVVIEAINRPPPQGPPQFQKAIEPQKD